MDAAAYAPLLQVGRAGFAWEWLRRDEDYRAAATHALASGEPSHPGQPDHGESSAERWGLHALEPPGRNALAARPIWRRESHPYVLQAAATHVGDDEDRLDLDRLKHLVTLVADSSGTEHLLLSDGCAAIRIDILSGTLRAGPACLHYQLEGFRRAHASLLVLRQLLALAGTAKFSPMLHPRERRSGRWILLLRTCDALAAGASQREIAETLLGLEPVEPRWRVQASSLRSRAQRLVREARRMAAGDYLELLDGR